MNILLYLGVVLFWGSSWFAIKFQLGLVPESISIAWRFFLASAILFMFCIVFQRKLKLSFFEFKHIAIQGFLLFSINYFFPFRDSIDSIGGSGINVVIQPGGSIRDMEVIDACNEHGISMIFTGVRCFKH